MRYKLSAISLAVLATFVDARTVQAQGTDLDSILNSPNPPSSGQNPAPQQNSASPAPDAPATTRPGSAPAAPPTPPDSAAVSDSSPAHPKKPAASFNGVTEEIIVTAQKREESIQNVNIAISAFSGDALRDLGVKSTADLAGLVPGFTFANSGYSIPIYTIRGVGFNETSQTASSTVGVYVDEVSLPYPAMTKGADLDLQRVEVLKGPQGTLYGRNTTGGAVNYIANKPTDSFSTGLTETYSSYKTLDSEGYISGPLGSDLKGRLSFRNINSQEGWQYDYVNPGRTNGKKDTNAVRSMLDWAPEDDFKVRFTIDGWQENSQPQLPQAFVQLNQSQIVGFAPSPAEVNFPLAPNNDARATSWDLGKDYGVRERFGNASIRADWTLDDNNTFTSIADVQNYKNDNNLDLDGMDVQEFEYNIDTRTNAASLESRLSGKLTENLQYTTGVFFSGDTVSEKRDFNLADNSTGDGGLLFKEIKLEGVQNAKTQAIFGQLEWQASDHFKYTLGLRGTNETRQYNECTRDVNGDAALAFTMFQDAGKLGLGQLIGFGLSQPQAVALLAFVNSKVPTNAQAVAFGNVVQAVLNTPIPGLIETALGGPHKGDCFTLNQHTNTAGPFFSSLDESNLSGKAAVDWTPLDNMRYYASVSLGYKSGSYPLLPASNSIQLNPVTEEKLIAYELGFKLNFLDNRLKLDGAGFHYDYSNKQLYTFYHDQIFGTLQRLDNVPKSVIDGAELSMQYTIVDGLFASLSGTYLKGQVTKYNGISSQGQPTDYAGREFAYTPPWSFAAVLNYEVPITDAFGVNVGVDGHYQSKDQGQLDNDPAFIQREFYVLNAHVGLKTLDGRWALTAFGHNLTDEVYYTSLYRLSDVGVRYTGMPRTIGVTLSYNYR